MSKTIQRCIWGFSLLLLLAVPALYGQSTYGNIIGNVTDPQGSVIPSARVTATEVRTGITRAARTDRHGDYQILNLEAGTYSVLIEHAGFLTLIKSDVILEARASLRVDFDLKIGTENTVVNVTAAAPVINTENGTVSEAQRGNEIRELPLNYRANSTSPFNAITTLPDVMVDGSGALGTASYSLAGNHPSQNEVSVDGFSVTSPRSSGAMVEVFPSSEAVSEMRVTSQLAPAEFGQIGDISFQTRGGTNKFHGGVYEYIQNDMFDATSYLATSKPKKKNNDFGGLFSGPIALPWYHGRNRTFFFVDYERNQQRGQTTIVNNVPTEAMRAGNLSTVSTSIIDPTTGLPFAGNIIPTTRLSPQSQNILNILYPLPNVTKAPGSINNNYVYNLSTPNTTNLFDIRIDHNLTQKQLIWGKFTWKNQEALNSQRLASNTGSQSYKNTPRIVGLSHTYTISSSLLNEFRFGFMSQVSSYSYPKFPSGAGLISQIGLQDLGTLPSGSAIPDFYFSGASGVSETPYGRAHQLYQNRFQFSDNMTWIRGRHTLKFGVDFRQIESSDYVSYNGADGFGVYYFNDVFTQYDFADFLLGLPQKTEIATTGPDWDGHGRAYAYFVQDSYQVSPRLTLQYGVRYEYHPPIHDSTLQMSNFVPSTGTVIVPNQKSLSLASPTFLQGINACGLATPNPPTYGNYPCTPVKTAAEVGMPESLRISDKTKVLPRFSFAYRLAENTVVRGGYGMYDQAMLGALFYRMIGIHTADDRTFMNADSNGKPTFQFPNTHPGGLGTVLAAGNNNFTIGTQTDLRDPYTQQWGLSVETALGKGTGLRLSYSGLHSVGLLLTQDYNQIAAQTTAYKNTQRPYPNWNKVRATTNGGNSAYNGLTAVVSHRFSQGVFFQSSLAWSKNLSDAEGDAPNGGFVGETGSDVLNRFDIKANRGDVSFTRRLRWLTTSNVELPFGRGRLIGGSVNRWIDAAIGGWKWSNIAALQSGPFLTPTYTGNLDPSGTNGPNRNGTFRPDIVPVSTCTAGTSGYRIYQGQCFFYGWKGQIGRFGSSGVGILRGPGSVTWNTGIAKEYLLRDGLKLRVEGTASNVLNRLNLGNPTLSVNSGSFGNISSQRTSEGAGPRTFQFGARLNF